MTTNDFPRCATCAHWVQQTERHGRCDVLKDVDFEYAMIGESGGASISEIETPDSFGCINHSEIKKG